MEKVSSLAISTFVFVLLLTRPAAAVCQSESSSKLNPVTPNGYTIESSYIKTLKTFPDITKPTAELPKGVSVLKEVLYREVDGYKLCLDVYLPSNFGPKHASGREAVVLVHGGGWWQGSRENLAPLAARLAERGIVSTVVSYRLAEAARYPAAVHDVRAAIDWLQHHSAEYEVDPLKITVAGSSAGGQIAALTGLTYGDPVLDENADSRGEGSGVNSIVNLDGLSDFTTPMALKHENDPRKTPSSAERWFGGRYEDKKALWVQASPIRYVNEQAPRTLFINSSRLRFSAGKSEYIEKMKALNKCVSYTAFDNSPHTYWLFEPWLTPTADIIAAFMKDKGYEKIHQPVVRSCD